jgi:uncharacterized protein with ParB-like and HNH nuclease domain
MVVKIKDEFEEFLKDFSTTKMGSLLQSSLFKVPPNQREYFWDKEHWTELWNDILDVIKYKQKPVNRFEKYHFFGPMFFVKENQQEIPIILDGQQRIATISLLLSLLRDLLFLSQQRGQTLYQISVTIGDIHKCLFEEIEGKNVVRVTLSKKNNDFFQKMIKISENPIHPIAKINHFKSLKLTKSNQKILNCYTFFLRQILNYLMKTDLRETSKKRLPDAETITNIVSSESSVKFFLDLHDVIVNKLYVLKIVVPTYDIEYEIFETLNQRGAKLEVKDLFRNLLFRYLEDPLGTDEVQSIWDEIDKICGDNFDEFLLHYWRSKFEFIRIKKLFRSIRKKFDELTTHELENFLREMIDEAQIYFALRNPNDPLWMNRDDIAELIYDLNYLNLKQALPLLLSAYIKFKDNLHLFKELLKTYLILCVRAYTVLGRNPNEFEEEYSRWAIQLRNNKIDINEIIKSIKENIPDDEEVQKGFIGLELSIDSARYLLCKINDALEKTQLHKVWRRYILTVEHVIPKKPDKNWESYLASKNMKHKDFINRLGNLTILSKDENKELGTKPYELKRNKYLEMNLPINTATFKDFMEFDATVIEEREKILAKLAIENKVWS